MSALPGKLGLALLLCLALLPGTATAQPAIRVAEITSERDCRLYETFWGGWLILECRNNFAELRTRLQSALAETGRFSLGGRGGYVVSGAITELGVTSSSAGGRDYQVGMTRAVASFDVRLRDAASGRVVYAGTVTKSVEVGANLSASGFSSASGSSPRAVYAELQREVSLAAARAIAFQVDPLQVTAVSGRQIRLNYGAPLLAIDTTIQAADASGFPVRYRVTEVMPDGAVAETAAQGGTVLAGARANVIENDGPAAGVNRYARVDLPTAEDAALGGAYSPPPPAAPPIARPAAVPPRAGSAPMMRSRPGGRAQTPRVTARRGEAAARPAAAAGRSGPRIALVIGVSTYGTLGNLANPTNDARALAGALQGIGFDVDLVLDPDQRTLKDAISRLGERMGRGGAGSTGLFYFAGHGIQSRGVNYLVPARAVIRREADLALEAVAADTVLSQMQEAGVSTNIIILDACRNMPLTRSFRSGGQGLAQMDAPNGSFIAYSTAPGSVAADGQGANSPFAAALLREIVQPGQAIESVFRNVRRSVLQETEGLQTPWDASSLVEPFFFRAQ